MSISTETASSQLQLSRLLGPLLLLISVVAAFFFFREGIDALLQAWQLPEYSHGPLIPVLSALLFLRQLKTVPVDPHPASNPWPGVALLVIAMLFGTLGKLSNIDDVVAYSLILWVGAMLLICFGWTQGREFWPPVLHLVYMLPLPAVLYYKLSTFLQGVSSELGVWFLHLLGVSVYLEGNIIDLGVFKLHVAEACSGLRYLFPILSFSYIFAVLYKGPTWQKAVLLLSAAPITVLMNSVRIAVAGVIVDQWGVEYVEGFSHFFEGWVIFMLCVAILFLLAWLMLFLHPESPTLADALDLETSGMLAQISRLRLVQATKAMVAATLLLCAGALAWDMRPVVEIKTVTREPFALFPRTLGSWQSSPPRTLEPSIEKALGADDYYQVSFADPAESENVEFFSAWYNDQTKGGTHSPEICLPSSGWEIAGLERKDVAPELGLAEPFHLNRAVIQKGESRMLAYYWFEQHGRHVAWDFAAKMYLLVDGVTIGRTDGAMVRLLTPIRRGESEQAAEERIQRFFLQTIDVLPRFIPAH